MRGSLSLKLRSLFSTQFFFILLLIFIAEVAAAVVALVYTTLVRNRDEAKGYHWVSPERGPHPPHQAVNTGLPHPG